MIKQELPPYGVPSSSGGASLLSFSKKKRKRSLGQLDSSFSNDKKRVRQDFSEQEVVTRGRVVGGFINPIRRDPVQVLTDALRTCKAGDRQITNQQLREFSAEHLSLVADAQLAKCAPLLLQIAIASKYENISRTALRLLRSILDRACESLYAETITQLLGTEGESLFTRASLDSSLLPLLTAAVTRGALPAPSAQPALVQQTALRSLRASDDVSRRVTAVRFLTASVLHTNKKPDTVALSGLESQLGAASSDRDSRVRVAAVDGLAEMARRDDALSHNMYTTIKKLTTDTDRHVRIETLRIVHLFAERFPTNMVTGQSGSKVPLADDAFAVVCHGVNDMEIQVRTEAARLLGHFQHVSDAFLDQTLDKKMMKNMKTTTESLFALTKATRVPKWKQMRRAENGGQSPAQSEWSSGKILHEAAPETSSGAKKEEEDSIIPHGACGAFVTALEDEFMAVRRAGVYSLGRLAATRPTFAASALDHLADMFNDEMPEVRLDAIVALTPLVSHGQLQKEQLEVILKCLDDAIPSSRRALRDLLMEGELADVACVRMSVNALTQCIARYPADKDECYSCLAVLGARHAVQCECLVREMLNLHPIYEPKEQCIEDVYYMARLIVVLNAAAAYPPVISLLPSYVLRHYRYMRAARPALVPEIEGVDGAAQAAARARLGAMRAAIRGGVEGDILSATYTRLLDVEKESGETERQSLRRFIIEDLEAVCDVDSSSAGAARLLSSLATTCNSLDSVRRAVLCGGGDLNAAEHAIEKELACVRCVWAQFSDAPGEAAAFLLECALQLLLFRTLVRLLNGKTAGRPERDQLRADAAVINDLFVSTGASLPSEQALLALGAIREGLAVGEGGADVKDPFTSTGIATLVQFAPRLPDKLDGLNDVKLKWAEITEPDGDVYTEKPVRFIAGLPTALRVTSRLHNLQSDDVDKVAVRVDYPDQTTELHRPRRSEIETLKQEWDKQQQKDAATRQPIRLSTEVCLHAATAWADAADVRISLVLHEESGSIALPSSAATSRPAAVSIRMHPMSKSC